MLQTKLNASGGSGAGRNGQLGASGGNGEDSLRKKQEESIRRRQEMDAIKTMTQDWKTKLAYLGAYNCEDPYGQIDEIIESLLKEEREKAYREGSIYGKKNMEEARSFIRNEVLDRAWEYVVKASREEHGSREDFIKFVNEHE